MSRAILQRIKGFGRKQWLLVAAFVVVVVLTAFFAIRTYQRAEYWRQHRDEPIAGWMRVGWVANSYHVPPPVLQTAIGLPPDVPDRRPLSKIAEDQGRSFDVLKSDLEKAIAEFRANRPSPGAAR